MLAPIEKATTFEFIAREWHSKGLWEPKHAASILSSLERYVFPLVGQKNIATITRQDIIQIISGIEERKALDVAKHVLAKP